MKSNTQIFFPHIKIHRQKVVTKRCLGLMTTYFQELEHTVSKFLKNSIKFQIKYFIFLNIYDLYKMLTINNKRIREQRVKGQQIDKRTAYSLF